MIGREAAHAGERAREGAGGCGGAGMRAAQARAGGVRCGRG
jgi:hypothetical protein